MTPKTSRALPKWASRAPRYCGAQLREKSIRHGDPGTLHILRTDPKTENNQRKE